MNWLEKTRELLGESLDTLEEGYKEAKAKWGDESSTTIEQFKKLAKANQFQGNEKNIDWWVKNKSFEDFKTTVNDVSNKGSKTKQKKITAKSPVDGAILEGVTENYEIWKIITYKASRHMGRLYKNKSVKWCISTDESSYFNTSYKNSSFYFFVRKEFENDKYDKIALQIQKDGDRIYWDVDDKNSDDESFSVKEIVDASKKLTAFERPFDIREYIDGTFEIVNGVYNVRGDVDIDDLGLTKLPVKFGTVSGDFTCYNNKLTSLEGAPKKVDADFICSYNELTSLKGAPQYIGRDFECYNNKLTSLEGAPQKVGGYFICSANNLTSLVGAPQKVGGDFYCSDNQLDNEDYEWLEQNSDMKGKIIK